MQPVSKYNLIHTSCPRLAAAELRTSSARKVLSGHTSAERPELTFRNGLQGLCTFHPERKKKPRIRAWPLSELTRFYVLKNSTTLEVCFDLVKKMERGLDL